MSYKTHQDTCKRQMHTADCWFEVNQKPNDPCNCYVRYLTEEVKGYVRWGSHNPACPVYRVSLDPVDRIADDEFRASAEIEPPNVH